MFTLNTSSRRQSLAYSHAENNGKCAHPGCITILSRYNPHTTCARHTDAAIIANGAAEDAPALPVVFINAGTEADLAVK